MCTPLYVQPFLPGFGMCEVGVLMKCVKLVIEKKVDCAKLLMCGGYDIVVKVRERYCQLLLFIASVG